MTVCIAARSLTNNCVAAACDTMLSRGNATPATDRAAIKMFPLVGGWGILYAGDPTWARGVADRAKNKLKESLNNERRRAGLEEVRRIMLSAFQEEMRDQIEDLFLSPYGVSLTEFRKKGKAQFGNDFEKINRPILEFSLGTSFLLCGIDNTNFPHIFSVTSGVLVQRNTYRAGGSVKIHDDLGHWAIGSGAEMALGSLGSRNISNLSIEDLMYRVVEAKFVAETAQGVGKSTVIVLWRNGFDYPCFLPENNSLRAAYDRAGLNHAPDEAREFIHETFKTAGLIDHDLPS